MVTWEQNWEQAEARFRAGEEVTRRPVRAAALTGRYEQSQSVGIDRPVDRAPHAVDLTYVSSPNHQSHGEWPASRAASASCRELSAARTRSLRRRGRSAGEPTVKPLDQVGGAGGVSGRVEQVSGTVMHGFVVGVDGDGVP